MKKIFAVLLAASMILTATACSGDKEDNDIETVEEDDRDEDDKDRDEDEDRDEDKERDEDEDERRNDEDDSRGNEDDRDDENDDSNGEVNYDKNTSHGAAIGEKISNEFFSMTVNSANRLTGISGYVPNNEAEYEYLCVNVKVQNNTTETINVGTYDFTVRWGNGSDDWDYAIEQDDFGFDKYPDEMDLTRLKSIEGNVFFIVPKNADKLYFEYIVTYDDDTTGDTYYVELEDLEYIEDPSADDTVSYENAVSYAAIGETQSTDYFDMTVNSVFTASEVNTYYVDEGYTFLCVDVTLKNTTSETVSTGGYYFCTYWDDGGEGEYTYVVEEAEIVDFPVYVDIAAGESLTGVMYFVVPVNNSFVFEFTDYYSETSYKDYRVELGSVAAETATV